MQAAANHIRACIPGLSDATDTDGDADSSSAPQWTGGLPALPMAGLGLHLLPPSFQILAHPQLVGLTQRSAGAQQAGPGQFCRL